MKEWKVKQGKLVFLAAVTGVFALLCFAVACGGGANSSNLLNSQAAKANVQIKMGDAPLDSLLAFELTISKIDLTAQGGGTTNVLGKPTDIELTHLAGTVETLSLAKVPAGTYTGAAITVSGAEVTYIPMGSTSPVEKQITLNTTVSVTFSAPITIGTGTSVLNFDLKLPESLNFDAVGNVTAVNPVFTVSVSAAAPGSEHDEDEENGGIEDAVGVVTSITQASGNTPASFAITPRLGGDPLVFTVDANTRFSDGLGQFSDLKTNMMVEVDAKTQTDGSLLATEVSLVDASEGLEAQGVIIDVAGSPVTSFTLLVQQGLGGGITSDAVGKSVTVDVTHAAFKDPLTDSHNSELLRNLPFTPKFDNATVSKGQRVLVNASGTMTTSGAINAKNVHLRMQALRGTIGPAVTGSNATLVLQLEADSAFTKLTGVSTINVYKVPKTEMHNMTALTQGTKVLVRGLLFFDGTSYQFVARRITLP